MVDEAMFASGTAEWGTDPKFVAALSKLFGPFDCDPCAGAREVAKAPIFYSRTLVPGSSGADGLVHPWGKSNFSNPPWRRAKKKEGITGIKIEPWIRKGIRESMQGKQTTFLLPARTETKFFKMAFEMSHTIAFVHGRLIFQRMLFDDAGNFIGIGGSTSAPFPSVVCVMGQPWPKHGQTIGLISSKGEILV